MFQIPTIKMQPLLFLLEPNTLVLCGSHFSVVTRLDQCGVVPVSSKECLPNALDLARADVSRGSWIL